MPRLSPRGPVIFLREVHRVIGTAQADFEAHVRDGFAPLLRQSGLGGLLWYLDQAHGSGPSYTAVTITAVAGGSAYEELAHSVQSGPLCEWAHRADQLRHEVSASLLVPLTWSPVQTVDLETIPPPGRDAPAVLYMEDTVWPKPGRLNDYIAAAGEVYAPSMTSRGLLSLSAAFQPALGGGRVPEVVLMQRVDDTARLRSLLVEATSGEHRQPGSWMQRALQWRDRWQSRLLRTASWSPLQ